MTQPMTRSVATGNGGKGASGDVVAETPQGLTSDVGEGTGTPTFVAGDPAGQGDRMEIDPDNLVINVTDVSGETKGQATAGNGPEDQFHGDSAPAATQPSRDISPEETLRLLREEKEKARIEREIQKLEQKKKRGFARDDDVAVTSWDQRHDDIAIQGARFPPYPTPYSGKSQRQFDTYVEEVAYTFFMQPSIYATPELKCRYAGRFLTGTPAEDWKNMQQQVLASPERFWSYEGFLKMHQDRLKSKHIRQCNLMICMKKAVQRNTQSVAELISYLNGIEQQFEPPLTEIDRFRTLFMALHPYLQDAIMKRGTVIKTRTKLEEVANLLERTVTPPSGIVVKRPALAGRGEV